MDSTHGKRAKEIARKFVAHTYAQRIAEVVVKTGDTADPAEPVQSSVAVESPQRLGGSSISEVVLPDEWTPMDTDFRQVDVPKADDPDLWSQLESRVKTSMPEFELQAVSRVQNIPLWRRYCAFRAELEVPDEIDMFRYEDFDTLQIVTSSRESLQRHNGEYGEGRYFAHHAIYAIANGFGWLDKKSDVEVKTPQVVMLLSVKVARGHCKDFGARCRSQKGDAAANKAGVKKGLLDDWAAADSPGSGTFAGLAREFSNPSSPDDPADFSRAPPRSEAGVYGKYDSVQGTEGDMLWSQNNRIRAHGDKFGRQCVTFADSQAYPEFILKLVRRPQRESELIEQEKGEQDREMKTGTRLFVKGYRQGSYVGLAKTMWGLLVWNDGRCDCIARVIRCAVE